MVVNCGEHDDGDGSSSNGDGDGDGNGEMMVMEMVMVVEMVMAIEMVMAMEMAMAIVATSYSGGSCDDHVGCLDSRGRWPKRRNGRWNEHFHVIGAGNL